MHKSDGGMLAAALLAILLLASMISWTIKTGYRRWCKPRVERLRLTLKERGMTKEMARTQFERQMLGNIVNDSLEDAAYCGILSKKGYDRRREELGRLWGLWEFEPKDQKKLLEELKAKHKPEELTGIAKLKAAISARRTQPA